MTLRRTQWAQSIALLSLVCYASSSWAQTGPDEFTETTTALAGSVTCPNGSNNPISIDPSTTVDSGTNNSSTGSTTLTLCGQTIYQASSINDISGASDTTTQDGDSGETDAQSVSLLGGMVTYLKEQATATCQTTDSNGDVSCGGVNRFTNLAINGALVTPGTYPPGATFNIVNAQVLSPSCTGVALFTGQLILQDSQIADNDTSNPSIEIEPLHLVGQATCVGLPLGATTHYDLRDDFFDFVESVSNGVSKVVHALGPTGDNGRNYLDEFLNGQ